MKPPRPLRRRLPSNPLRPGGSRPTSGTATDIPAIGGAAGAAHSPQRRCIVTGESKDRGQLLRFVVAPDGAIVPVVAGRLPGRGLWLTPRRDIVERALTKRIFARAARQPLVAPPGLADRVEALLARRCCDALGLARRAGLAVAGVVGEAPPGYSGAGADQADLCTRRAAASRGAAGAGRPGRGLAGAALLRRARSCSPRRSCGGGV